MGLIARVLEQAGISTVCFNLLLATSANYVRPPRTIWLPFFPFSLPLGLPGNEFMQRHLLLDALTMLVSADTPGIVRRLPYRGGAKVGTTLWIWRNESERASW